MLTLSNVKKNKIAQRKRVNTELLQQSFLLEKGMLVQIIKVGVDQAKKLFANKGFQFIDEMIPLLGTTGVIKQHLKNGKGINVYTSDRSTYWCWPHTMLFPIENM